MAIAAVGLRTHIWNNNLKSIVLLALYPLILGGIVWAVFWALGMSLARHSGTNLVRGYSALGDPKGFPIQAADTPFQPDQSVLFANSMVLEYWPMILSAVAVWFMIAWFFHTSMIRRLARSHPVTRQEEPELYNLLENLCISQGVRMPHLEIIETHARNAFASGVSEDSYAITVTQGLMNSLTRDELEGVVETCLRKAALWDEVKDKQFDNALALSGGQQQRLCIARTLSVDPEIILMDEPCSALDPIATARIEDLIFELKQQYTIIIVTHNMQQAQRASDITGFFMMGKLVEVNSTQDLFLFPQKKETEDYISGRFG